MSNPRILVAGWIGATNAGDALIAEEVAELVRDEGAEPTLITIDPTRLGDTAIAAVRHKTPLDTVGLLRAAAAHDGLIFGGGGLIQDETGPWSLPFHLSRVAAARLTATPWAACALGVGAVRRASSKRLMRAAFRGAVAVSVRDAGSQRRLAALTGIEAALGIDPVLAKHPTRPTNSPAATLAVCLRPPNRWGQRRVASNGGPDRELITTWASAIDEIAASHHLDVNFIAWDSAHDQAVHEAVAAQMSTPATLVSPTPAAILDQCADAEVVITMRYHGAVAAVRASRPTVAINYSPKMADLAAEVTSGLELVDVDAEATAIVEAANQVTKTQLAVADHDWESRCEANRQVVQTLIAACH